MSDVQMSCDPELVILNSRLRPVSAHKWVGKKSEEDRHIVRSGPYRAAYGSSSENRSVVFRDGFNVEVNLHYDICRGLLVNNWFEAVNSILRKLPSSYSLGFLPWYEVAEKELAEAPEDVRQAGCSPALDAYTGGIRRPSYEGSMSRCAGGHMHFSIPDRPEAPPHFSRSNVLFHPEHYPELVMLFDIFVGGTLAYIIEDEYSLKRREQYGRAGEYRQQIYPGSSVAGHQSVGIEYRVPGPEMWSSRPLISLAYLLGRSCIENFSKLRKLLTRDLCDAAQAAINEHRDFSYLPEVIEKLSWMSYPSARFSDIVRAKEHFAKNRRLVANVNSGYWLDEFARSSIRDNWDRGWDWFVGHLR